MSFRSAVLLGMTICSATWASGCTTDSIKRAAYGAVQSTGQEQCINSTPAAQSINCIRNMPYDEYQRRRSEVNSNR